jgi:hypothetical protein
MSKKNLFNREILLQINYDSGELMRTYESLKEASNTSGITNSSISRMVTGNAKLDKLTDKDGQRVYFVRYDRVFFERDKEWIDSLGGYLKEKHGRSLSEVFMDIVNSGYKDAYYEEMREKRKLELDGQLDLMESVSGYESSIEEERKQLLGEIEELREQIEKLKRKNRKLKSMLNSDKPDDLKENEIIYYAYQFKENVHDVRSKLDVADGKLKENVENKIKKIENNIKQTLEKYLNSTEEMMEEMKE